MKKKVFLTLIVIALCRVLHASPMAAVSGITGNTQRASALSLVLEQHIVEILKKNSFSTIDPEIVHRELVKFSCIEEKCVLQFAENAEINLLISGTVTDREKFIIIKLEAFGINIPFNKRIINKYEIKIPMDVKINSREFSFISEEHAAQFLAATLNNFLYPVVIKSSADSFVLSDNLKISGVFKFYSKDKINSFKESGETEISEGRLTVIRGKISGDNFILIPFKNKSKEIDEFYRAQKRKAVFRETSLYDTLFLFAVTPIASASMPFSSPYLGYYINSDWAGLGLWALNAPPYIYMELRGFLNSPERLKRKKENISRDDRAMNYFAWYMLCSGGMPLFIDSYTSDYIHRLSYFTGNNELLGNSATAAMFSLTSNGAGLFYRGERFWGYFYFHLNNILLYMTLREFSAPEYYNGASGTYTKGNTDRNRAITYCSIFALSKTVELIHSVTSRENISSGEIIDQYVIPGPLFTLDEKGNPVYGINVTLKF